MTSWFPPKRYLDPGGYWNVYRLDGLTFTCTVDVLNYIIMNSCYNFFFCMHDISHLPNAPPTSCARTSRHYGIYGTICCQILRQLLKANTVALVQPCLFCSWLSHEGRDNIDMLYLLCKHSPTPVSGAEYYTASVCAFAGKTETSSNFSTSIVNSSV